MKTPAVRLLSTLLVTLVLAQALTPPQAHAGPWPALETDRDKLAYGLALRNKIPGFFSGTFNYGLDWWTIASTQERMKRELTPLYPKSLDTAPLAIITLSDSSERTVPNAAGQSEWRGNVLSALEQKPASTTKADLVSELQLKSRALSTTKPGELLNFLMRELLKKGMSADIMRLPFDEKVELLRTGLPEDLTQTGFYTGSNKRFTPENVRSRTHAIEILQTLNSYESQIPAVASAVFAAGSLPLETRLNEIVAEIRGFGADDFAKSQDIPSVESNLSIAIQSATQDPAPADIAKSAAAAVTKTVQRALSHGSTLVNVLTPTLRLTQQPRDIAVLRSSVALDCTHTCSFAKVDLPAYRAFYVVDVAQNKEIAYVETETRRASTGDVLYVTSINGPSLSVQQAELVLNMLDAQKTPLGVKSVALAARNLEFQMNYDSIIQFFHSQNRDKPVIEVQSKNPQISAIVDSAIDADYQKDYQNHEAVIFVPTMRDLKTSFQTKANDEKIEGRIDAKQVLVFALELDAAQRSETPAGQHTDGERAVVTAGLDLRAYKVLRDVVRNVSGKPYQQSLEATRLALGAYGIEMDKAFIKDHAHVFYDAQLAASDAIDGNLRKSTFILVAQLIKRGLWHPTWGMRAFGSDPAKAAAFNESKEIEGVLRWAASDLNFHSIQIRNMVNSGLGLPQMREPQMKRDLTHMAEHGWGWGPDLAREMLKTIEIVPVGRAPICQDLFSKGA